MIFTKMHGCGNDFIVVDCFNKYTNITKENAIKLCSRNYGVGADGILIISPSKIADIKMAIINADGTDAEMCGNGIRCIAKYCYDNDLIDKNKKNINVETGAGIKKIELIIDEENNCNSVKVNMGSPEFLENPAKKDFDLYCVSVGNPHAVMLIKEFDDNLTKKLGFEIENHKGFINKTNVEFVKIIDRNNVETRIWERGCGETRGCGTGACAIVSVLNHYNLLNDKCKVKMLGGELFIEIIDNEIFMTGEAVKVFGGEIEL